MHCVNCVKCGHICVFGLCVCVCVCVGGGGGGGGGGGLLIQDSFIGIMRSYFTGDDAILRQDTIMSISALQILDRVDLSLLMLWDTS